MIASSSHQAWLFYSPLARQALLLKDDLLDPVDQLLDDPRLVDLVRQPSPQIYWLSTAQLKIGVSQQALAKLGVSR